MSIAATRNADFVVAFRADGEVSRFVDFLRRDPGRTGGLGAVDSVASGDGPFVFALFVF